jgi:hypothetical protein
VSAPARGRRGTVASTVKPSSPSLALLHTAATQTVAFEACLASIAPDVRARHQVDASLLAEARAAGGIPPALRVRLRDTIAALFDEGARVVVCTCSTLGGCAEEIGAELRAPVLRIDRPMAERAIAAGSPILVVAALESTLAPTCELLRDTAKRQGRTPVLRTLLCDGAWPFFEAGERAAYHAEIAAAVRRGRGDARAAVLAQASMAGAEALCEDLGIPVLSSPRSGLEAALDLLADLSK